MEVVVRDVTHTAVVKKLKLCDMEAKWTPAKFEFLVDDDYIYGDLVSVRISGTLGIGRVIDIKPCNGKTIISVKFDNPWTEFNMRMSEFCTTDLQYRKQLGYTNGSLDHKTGWIKEYKKYYE